ncbi:acetolactate synthase-1/2/3 large subunit [Stella humosa]|uniref:Acetolactate synthase-1/2/3 large subunit n=1 Tax=Stella humosa TaxID=94 RepID=A0A3N1M745_9PROT|nr:thiamine pyrophosphate-binding protein [Stella humosa]ROQ03324.1 acetolactate synthase-1/2/3 large subunit [Stella humosa]BBK29611.1 acetolactate synthase [Stella humosa]
MTEGANVPAGRMNGGRAMAEMLRLAEVGPMFGMGGFQLLPFYDALHQLGLRHFLINDERNGAFAADAYARVTNRPGVCDGTLGPGATNLVTGLVESLNAGTPMVAIAGDSHRAHSWKNMTQECRQVDILRPAVKELIRVELTSRLPEMMRRAFAVATAGRPGPVLLDVPEDVCHGEHDFTAEDFYIPEETLTAPSRRTRPAQDAIARAVALLARAKRPLLLVGGGVHLSAGQAALQRLAESCGIPVAHTMSGKGSIACTHPLSVGLFGRYSRIANDLIAASDCLLVVGCKLGEIATRRYALMPAGVPMIHLDIVAEEIGRHQRTHVALWGDAAAGLDDLTAALADDAARLRRERQDYLAEIPVRMAKWREEASPRLQSTERPINMARLCQGLNNVMPAESIVVADGGFAAHWTGLIYDTKAAGRHYIADRGLASIGYGLPGGMGAALAAPGKPVVAVTGDGGFNMGLGELETARRCGANLTVVVVNNAASGYVKALQHAMYGRRYQSSDLVEMNYAAIAEQMGCRGIRVEDPAAVDGALAAGIAENDRPTVIDVVVTRDPGQMLPGVDNRAVEIKKGDRVA